MTTDMQPSVIDFAHAYAALGWRVVPIGPGTKWPVGMNDWQHQATANSEVIESWWNHAYRGYGVGIATGAESGVFVLDIDHAEGRAVQRRWEAMHGPLPPTVTAISGSGDGEHYLFNYPGEKVRTRRGTPGDGSGLPVGIDVRGDGGQAVAAPTVHPSGGRYRFKDGYEPWNHVVADAPAWLLDIVCERPTTPPAPARNGGIPLHTSSTVYSGDSPVEWYNRSVDFASELRRYGWTEMHRLGDDVAWCRPGKDPRLGHSAILHDDDRPVLVIFSTNAPAALLTRDSEAGGDTWRVDAFDFMAAMEHGGDKRAAAQAVKARMPGAARVLPVSFVPPPEAQPVVSTSLDERFWTHRPVLDHVRIAARARLVSPAAVLAALLTRVAAFTPPSTCLPPTIGTRAPLSLYAALYGPSGAGKSTPVGAATDLLGVVPPGCAGPHALGSGEGMIEAFMEQVEVPTEGRKAKVVKRQARYGVMFTLDEGSVLGELGNRRGATLLPYLRTAWSGGLLGAANASAETWRMLQPGSYSLGVLSLWQTQAARELLGDVNGGTPQRFVWVSTLDPDAPAVTPAWPGALDWAPPPGIQHDGRWIPNEMYLDPEVVAAIVEPHKAKLRGGATGNPFDAHRNLNRLKVAAVFAVLDGRRGVDPDDWWLAGCILDASDGIRDWVLAEVNREQAQKMEQDIARHVARATAAEDSTHARALRGAARSVWRAVGQAADLSVPITRRDLTLSIAGKYRKLVTVDEAVEEAVRLAWLIPDETPLGVRLGNSRPAS